MKTRTMFTMSPRLGLDSDCLREKLVRCLIYGLDQGGVSALSRTLVTALCRAGMFASRRHARRLLARAGRQISKQARHLAGGTISALCFPPQFTCKLMRLHARPGGTEVSELHNSAMSNSPRLDCSLGKI